MERNQVLEALDLSDYMELNAVGPLQFRADPNSGQLLTTVENDDFVAANREFEILDKMLHPENSLKKILKIQLTGLSEND